jgi:putative ABC transport system substrate-binding protein
MDRRSVLAALAAAATTWPLGAQAQQPRRIPKVGFVQFASAAVDQQLLVPFRQGLKALGYVEGRTIIIENRDAQGNVERGYAFIDELAALPVDVFLSPGPAATRAYARKTRIPVVAIALPGTQSDPDLFQSFARPGGTVTGFSAYGEEMSAKRIEILKEILPTLRTVGVMHNATDPTFKAWGTQTMADAGKQGLQALEYALSAPSPAAVTEGFRKLAGVGSAGGGVAMIVIRDFMTAALLDDIARAAAAARIAVVGEWSPVAQAGALFTYGADFDDLLRRAAGYVDRILKGEKAGDLPIQLPTKFELVVNQKTARALGVTVPPSVLVRADEVIE